MPTKLGRNDPCHCGSGDKYKKCCLERDEEAHALEQQAGVESARDFDMQEVSDAHLDTPGTCTLCGAEVMDDATLAHLADCAPEHDAKTGPLGVIFIMRVLSPELPGYWLEIEIVQDARLSALDRVLRSTWLECCGHLSMFVFEDAEYHSSTADLDEWGPGPVPRRSMAARLKTVVQDEGCFTYEYDFGSTTELDIVVLAHRSGRLGRSPARVVARNAEPTWPCGICGQPATLICAVCRYDGTNPFVCDAHSKRHSCGESEAFLPVVNSPRIGVCAYGVRD